MAGLGQSAAQGAAVGTMIGGPVGTAVGFGVGILGGIGSFFGASSKRNEANAKINLLTGQRASSNEALSNLDSIESEKIGLAQDQYGSAESKAMFGVGSSLFSATRAGMTAASNIGFAGSSQLDTQLKRGEESMVTSFGFEKRGLQDLLGQNLLNISEEIGGQRSSLETNIASIDAEISSNTRKASTSGFFQSLLGG